LTKSRTLGPNWLPLYISGGPSSSRYVSFCAISGDTNIAALRNIKFSIQRQKIELHYDIMFNEDTEIFLGKFTSFMEMAGFQ
jgi:hypothetical protein